MNVLGLVDVPLSWLLLVLGLVLLYQYVTWNNDFFVNRGIPGPTPKPFVGNTDRFSMFGRLTEWKKVYGNFFGFFVGREPIFVVSDVDVLKEVFVKSFDSFRNRRRVNFMTYPFNLGVFFLEDDAWKRVRNIISPTFSSGKLKKMHGAINECAGVLTKNFSKALGQDKVDVKQYFGAFTMDVISRTAFGIRVDSQNDFNHPFVVNAKKIFQPTKSDRFINIVAGALPFAVPVLGLLHKTIFQSNLVPFFSEAIANMVKQRQKESKETKESRADFLQLMMDAEIQENSEDMATGVSHPQMHKRLTMDELIGQGILFFIAGYETTASTLQFAAYSLATNPHTQEKLYNEIMEVIGNDEPTYENLGKLKYMDNVISETLRLYPPGRTLHRRATEDINLGKVSIPKGYTVFIPVFSLQRDPELFHHPDEFLPERHDEELNPLSQLAFGYGPRICIGKRLALVEAKLALVHVLRKVKFERGPETLKDLTFRERSAVLVPDPPIILKVSPRC